MDIWHAIDFRFFDICTNIEHIVALRLGYGMAWIGAGVLGLLLGLLYDTTPKTDPREKDCTGTQTEYTACGNCRRLHRHYLFPL